MERPLATAQSAAMAVPLERHVGQGSSGWSLWVTHDAQRCSTGARLMTIMLLSEEGLAFGFVSFASFFVVIVVIFGDVDFFCFSAAGGAFWDSEAIFWLGDVVPVWERVWTIGEFVLLY
jgi:hypothetical protein